MDHAQGSLVRSGSLLSVLTDNPEGLTGLVELDGALAARMRCPPPAADSRGPRGTGNVGPGKICRFVLGATGGRGLTLAAGVARGDGGLRLAGDASKWRVSLCQARVG